LKRLSSTGSHFSKVFIGARLFMLRSAEADAYQKIDLRNTLPYFNHHWWY
jgi:hypothetical protein